MDKYKIYRKIVTFFMAAILVITQAACGTDKEAENAEPETVSSEISEESSEEKAEIPSGKEGRTALSAVMTEEIQFTEKDLSGEIREDGAVRITLNASQAQIEGAQAGMVTSDTGRVTIFAAGTYIFSGSFEGTIRVEAQDTDKVQIVLAGAQITADTFPGIYVENADKTFITLMEGTQNKVETIYPEGYDAGEEKVPNAAIFSKDDLVINGEGELEVTTNYKDGIASKDDLKITGGVITVNAVDDGIRGKDSLRIAGGVITIDAKNGDGLKTTRKEVYGKGYLYILGGVIDIKAGNDAVNTTGDIFLEGGTITIDCGDDGFQTDTDMTMDGGVITISHVKKEVVKVGGDFYVNGGVISE